MIDHNTNPAPRTPVREIDVIVEETNLSTGKCTRTILPTVLLRLEALGLDPWFVRLLLNAGRPVTTTHHRFEVLPEFQCRTWKIAPRYQEPRAVTAAEIQEQREEDGMTAAKHEGEA